VGSFCTAIRFPDGDAPYEREWGEEEWPNRPRPGMLLIINGNVIQQLEGARRRGSQR
jgi:hypothetical protein